MKKHLAWIALGLAVAAACGGSVNDDSGKKKDASVGGTGGTPITGGTHSGGKGGHSGSGGTGGKIDGGSGFGGTGGFIDPGCPDAAPPPPDYQCDPYGPNQCPPGQGCYPYVIYPSAPCDQEHY